MFETKWKETSSSLCRASVLFLSKIETKNSIIKQKHIHLLSSLSCTYKTTKKTQDNPRRDFLNIVVVVVCCWCCLLNLSTVVSSKTYSTSIHAMFQVLKNKWAWVLKWITSLANSSAHFRYCLIVRKKTKKPFFLYQGFFFRQNSVPFLINKKNNKSKYLYWLCCSSFFIVTSLSSAV